MAGHKNSSLSVCLCEVLNHAKLELLHMSPCVGENKSGISENTPQNKTHNCVVAILGKLIFLLRFWWKQEHK